MDFLREEESPEERKNRLADDDFRSGRGVPMSEVRAWVQSWGTENELRRPEPRQIPNRHNGIRSV